ncbi:renal dipeptidase family [Dichotomocladium elegans]|nr:renal dipeptidase family [Dichotomocladium elegans]
MRIGSIAAVLSATLAVSSAQNFHVPQVPFLDHVIDRLLGDAYLKDAHAFLRKHPLTDTHNDWPMYVCRGHLCQVGGSKNSYISNRHLSFFEQGKINDLDLNHLNVGHTDIERLHAGGVGGQFWSIFYPCEEKNENQMLWAMHAIDTTKRMIAKYPKDFEYVTDTKGFQRAYRHKRIASMLGMEGGQYISNSAAALRQFYELGVRYMTLTHNCHTEWAESCCDPNPPNFDKGLGLTEFGQKLVKEMNRLGMLVDISHVAHSTMHAVLNVTRAPVLFSHSSSNALCGIERNVPDAVLERLDETDGVVMINFYSRFVNCDYPNTPATVATVADHIEYIARLAGRHRVGLGADFSGIDATPEGLDDVSQYPNLFAELMRRGWSKKDLKALSSENFLRVWKKVEKVAEKLQQEEVAMEDLFAPIHDV